MMTTIVTITLSNRVHCKIYFEMINARNLLKKNLKIFLQKLRVSRYHKIIKNLEMFKILKFAQNLFLSKDFLFCPSTNLRCKSLMSILVLPKELAILFKQSSSQNSWSISKVWDPLTLDKCVDYFVLTRRLLFSSITYLANANLVSFRQSSRFCCAFDLVSTKITHQYAIICSQLEGWKLTFHSNLKTRESNTLSPVVVSMFLWSVSILWVNMLTRIWLSQLINSCWSVLFMTCAVGWILTGCVSSRFTGQFREEQKMNLWKNRQKKIFIMTEKTRGNAHDTIIAILYSLVLCLFRVNVFFFQLYFNVK